MTDLRANAAVDAGLTTGKDYTGPGPWDHLDHGDPSATTGHKHSAFSVPQSDAVPVNERASYDWNASTQWIGAESAGVGPVKIVDRQAGRDWVLLMVPTVNPITGAANATGVYIASRDSQLEVTPPQGFFLAAGASISISSEGAIWAVSQTVGTPAPLCIAEGHSY
jgi:hypothetical protein